MSIWLCIPSARPAAEANPILQQWKDRGYQIALWRTSSDDLPVSDLVLTGPYPGYAQSTNAVIAEVLRSDPACSWVVGGGDDIEPDPILSASEIGYQCGLYFCPPDRPGQQCTYGVMQPTGDRWANGSIDRIAGSPWIGREFCRRVYGGKGPLFSGYGHMFADEELQCVASRLGIFQQRRDITHMHCHWMRTPGTPCPPHMVKWVTADHWDESRAMFEMRRSRGFPGHTPSV
jgi:hypothetical protein